MRGQQAAIMANSDLLGMTVHRRGINMDGQFFDLHTRICDAVLQNGQFSYDYLQGLGNELSALDRAVYEEVVGKLRAGLESAPGQSIGQEPLILTEKPTPIFLQRFEVLFYTVSFVTAWVSQFANYSIAVLKACFRPSEKGVLDS